MKRSNVVVSIVSAVICSSILMLGLAGCGGDSGPTPGGLAIVTASLPEGQINQPYSASVGASGGTQPYLWSVTPALPAGLSFNTQSGAITGTPGTVGTSPHTFTLVDSSVPPQTIATSLGLTIKPPLAITTTSLPDGNIGAVYGQPVQTVGGFGPLTFSITSGTLPQGLSLDPNTGVIAGTPTTTGNSSFTVRVADTSGQQDTKPFSIIINPQSPPQITTTSLPSGTVSVPYGPTTIQAAAGIGQLTWSITVGSLPPGLTISSLTGPSVIISGTPTTQGTSNFTMRVTDTLGQFFDRALSIAINLPAPPNITITTLPAGTIGQNYNQPVPATGTGTLTWSISAGTLPPGLTMSSTTGVITGTPTATGNFPFTVRVADTFGQSDTQAFPFVVSTSNPPQISTTSLPAGTVSQPYSQTVQANNGIGTLTWSISAGSLPPGLTLGPPLTGSSVTVSGTPTTQGTFPFTVTVTDTLGQFATQALSITINLPAPPNITISTLPAGSIGQTYNQAVLATGTGPLTWSIVSPGTGTLPPGLTLNPSTGTITGAPSAIGDFPFTVRVADTFGQSDTQALSIHVATSNPPQISTTSLPAGTVSQPYTQTVQANNGIGTLTWSISVGSLPPGLTLGPPLIGSSVTISGTPTAPPGTSNFTVRVTDSLGQSDTQALSIVINPAAPPPPTPPDITTLTLPDGAVGVLYSQTVQVTGGTAPFTWSIPIGALPAGLQLDAGVISGTPTTPGLASFTVQVQDAGGLSDTQALSITISP